MDIIDEITTKMRKKLINEYGFIPLDKLGQEQVSTDNIDVGEWREFIRKCGLPSEDFYYLDWNRTCPIVYYRGLVYINPIWNLMTLPEKSNNIQPNGGKN